MLISVELANSFCPRKLSAAPIGFFLQSETLFEAQVEHLILWLEVVHEEEAVGVPSRLLVDPVKLVLRQQGAQLFDDGLQLVDPSCDVRRDFDMAASVALGCWCCATTRTPSRLPA